MQIYLIKQNLGNNSFLPNDCLILIYLEKFDFTDDVKMLFS